MRDEARRRGSCVLESEHRRKDGSVFPVEVTATYVSLDRDYVLAVARDIADRKRAEAEMKRLEEQLRQAQKLEAVGRLASGIAHDFNNILGVIVGYGEIVSRSLLDDDPLRSKVAQILEAARRAAALTRELLAFSRQQVLDLRILDLNAIVSEMDPMLRRLIGEDIALATALGPELGSVEGDLSQLQQVIMNLAVNAREAMTAGGQLRIETSNFDLAAEDVSRYPLLKTGSYVSLVVTDTGSGIDASARAHVFEPFFTTKEFGKGLGLGLSTVYGIVEQSGGHIYVNSEAGVGTSFRIYLPRAAGVPYQRTGESDLRGGLG
jgi:signal transduction histidine kinase